MTIRSILLNVVPHDDLEKQQINHTLGWIDANQEIYRLSKPANPPLHLAAYFILIDSENDQLLLARHKKAEHLWLPTGGHVEKGEPPQATVKRELEEELRVQAEFLFHEPVFFSLTPTLGESVEHTHISLWYALKGNASFPLDFDQEELTEVRWFEREKIPYECSYPDLQRFCHKLFALLG